MKSLEGAYYLEEHRLKNSPDSKAKILWLSENRLLDDIQSHIQ